MAFKYADVLARWAERSQNEQALHTALLLNVMMGKSDSTTMTITLEEMIQAHATHSVTIVPEADGSFIIFREKRPEPLQLQPNEGTNA